MTRRRLSSCVYEDGVKLHDGEADGYFDPAVGYAVRVVCACGGSIVYAINFDNAGFNRPVLITPTQIEAFKMARLTGAESQEELTWWFVRLLMHVKARSVGVLARYAHLVEGL